MRTHRQRFLIFKLIFVSLVTGAGIAQAKDVNLKWKAIEGAKKYDLEVARDLDFQDVVFSKTVKEPFYNKDLSSGKYFLRVRCVDDDGLASKWSSAFKLVVTAPVDPVEKTVKPQNVTFVGKAPHVNAAWKVDDKATNFKVHLIKDGKEVQTTETSQPKVEFHPTTAGDYKVVVNSGYDGYYGPSVTVDEFHVEQKALTPPQLEMPGWKRYDSRHTINVKWMPSPSGEAKSYVVKIYKASDFTDGGRTPASDSKPVAQFDDVTDSQLKIPPLPPGRYIAAVQSMSADDSASSATTIPIDVSRGKPVEIEKYDLTVGYGVTGVNINSQIIEAGPTVNSNSLGSAIVANGNLWLYDSSWGMRVGGSWNSFVSGGNTITYSDLILAGQHRFTSEEGLRKEFRTFLGARAWNMPVIIPTNGGNNNNNNSSTNIQEFSTTAFGPVGGLEYIRPVSDHVALVGSLQVSVPVTASPVVGGGPVQNLQSNNPSGKIQIGAKIAIPGNIRLLALLGFESDQVDFTPFAGPATGNGGPSGSAPPGAQDKVNINYPSLTLGIEAANDGNIFRANTMSSPPAEIFSNIDFTANYTVAPTNYNGSFAENVSSGGNNNNNPAPSFSTSGTWGALVNFEASGFFKESHSGVRMVAGWDDFSYENTNIVNPQFVGQWGYRPGRQDSKEGWNWSNYLGLRLWRIPLMSIQTGFFAAESSQLLGPVDTFVLTKSLGKDWSGRLLAELSSPVFLTDKNSQVTNPQFTAPSGRAEIAGIHAFTPDLSMGLGVGYKMDQLSYTPSGVSGTSTVQMAAPTFNLFGKYSF